jgi:nucleoside-diphosphate-sugar epimerase
VIADRETEDAAGTFPERIRDLKPDVAIDMLCFTLDSARSLVEGLRGHVQHLIHCGSIWMHGPSQKLPIVESDSAEPTGEYGVQKAAIARMLRTETEQGGLVTTSLHPGHISGPGWHIVTPLGNLDPTVWQTLASGAVLDIPGLGAELLAHVHADDVAQAFALAVEHRDQAAGEAFHVTAASSLTVRGFARIAAGWFGREASLRSVTWSEFRAGTAEHHANASWEHLSRSHHMSIEKAQRLLGYRPTYQPEAAAKEAVRWLIDHGELTVEDSMTG